jgi:hypothetical protein
MIWPSAYVLLNAFNSGIHPGLNSLILTSRAIARDVQILQSILSLDTMVFSVFSVLSIVSVFSTWMMLISISRAATITSPPEALITRAPLVRREESSVGTFGYFSASESDGTTSCKFRLSAWTVDIDADCAHGRGGMDVRSLETDNHLNFWRLA